MMMKGVACDAGETGIAGRPTPWSTRFALLTGLSIISALVYALSRTDTVVLRDHLRQWQFWSLSLQVVIAGVLTAVELPRMIRLVAAGRQRLCGVAALSLMAAFMAGVVAPRTAESTTTNRSIRAWARTWPTSDSPRCATTGRSCTGAFGARSPNTTRSRTGIHIC